MSARLVLDEHERMAPVGAGKKAFLDAVSNSPPLPAKLIAALKRHGAADGVVVKPAAVVEYERA